MLLQAMALAKPVVVTRTSAIATGYAIEDGENVRLVAPGDGASFGRVLVELVGDPDLARVLGAHARATVERALTWEHYVGRMETLIRASAGAGAR